MSQTKMYDGPTGYRIVAGAKGQKIVYYASFGSYQGEWIMLSKDHQYYLYKDYYGSCSGCDSYEAELGYDSITLEAAVAFAEKYKPFLEIPVNTMINLVKNGTFKNILPKNIRDDYGEIDIPQATTDMNMCVRIEESLPINVRNILKVRNAEIKQRALKAVGYEKFIKELNALVIDRDEDNELIRIDNDILFLRLQDSSTPRKYLLRVPPSTQTLKEGLAWTFHLETDEYSPIVET